MKLMSRKSSTTLVSPNSCDVFEPNIAPDVTLDMAGYKSSYQDRERERADQTKSSSSSNQYQFPAQQSLSTPYLTNPPFVPTQSAGHSPYAPSPISSPSRSPSPSSSPASPPLLRATSEPPPDMDPVSETHTLPQLSLPQTQEYSWEWGAFPQPSPIKTSFSKGGRIESNNALWGTGRRGRTHTVKKSRLSGMKLPPMKSVSDQSQEQDERLGGGGLAGRSRSVPPLLDGNLTRNGNRRSREYKEYEDADRYSGTEHQGNIGFNVEREAAIFGTGGTLSASEDDPATLILSIDGRKIEFQLSLVGGGGAEDEDENNSLKRRGRDEMEVARLFNSARVNLAKLLDDDNVIRNPRLVIRWAQDQYVALPFCPYNG